MILSMDPLIGGMADESLDPGFGSESILTCCNSPGLCPYSLQSCLLGWYWVWLLPKTILSAKTTNHDMLGSLRTVAVDVVAVVVAEVD